MAKKPVKASLIKRTVALVKRNPIKSATAILAFLAVVPGGIGGAAYSWSAIEPAWVAQRYWVRDNTHGPLLKRIIGIQLVQNDDRARRLLRDVQRQELELQSEQAKATPQYHKLVQEGIERTKAELREIDKENKSLFNEKAAK